MVVPVYGNELSLVELYERIAQACEAAHVELTLQFVNDRPRTTPRPCWPPWPSAIPGFVLRGLPE